MYPGPTFGRFLRRGRTRYAVNKTGIWETAPCSVLLVPAPRRSLDQQWRRLT